MKSTTRPARFSTLVFLSLLTIPCLLQTGCTSSYTVSSTPGAGESFDTFNADAKDERATVVLQDGRELHTSDVIAGPDSTSFLEDSSNARTVVPTHAIQKIELPIGGLGFLEGAGWGTLSGVGIGLV